MSKSWYENAVIKTKAQKEEAAAAAIVKEGKALEKEEAREAAGFKDISVVDARAWIDNQFTGITTLEELVAANVKVWKKAMPYILPPTE